jgi:peroxiredoxin Q/BCP
MVKVGRKVPKLRGTVDDGSTLALADFRGQHLVVYFYPKDATPGCTNEALGFRDLYPKFRRGGCAIVGVSRDGVASHAKFRARHALPFPLVADVDGAWCEAFGVIGEKMLYGKRHVGVIRSTFLIDPDGALAREWRGVRVPGHVEAVLEALVSPP